MTPADPQADRWLRQGLDRLSAWIDPVSRGWIVVFSGNTLRLALGFVASVLIARSLGPAGFGIFAMLGAVGNITGVAVDFGLTDTAVKHIAAAWAVDRQAAQERSRVLFWLRAGTVTLLMGVASAVSVPLLRRAVGPSSLEIFMPLLLLGVAATALSSAVSAILQATGYLGRFSAVMLTNAVLTALLAVVLALTGLLTILTALLVLGIGTALAAFAVGLHLLPVGWRLDIPSRALLRREGRGLMEFGRWQWPANSLTALTAQLDLLLLGHWQGGAAVGAYALALNLATKVDVVNQSLYTVLLPAASALRGQGDVRRYVAQGMRRSCLLSLALLPLFPLAGYVITFFYGPAYAPAVGLFRLLLGVVIFEVFTTPLVLLVYHLDRPKLLAAAAALRVAVLLLIGVALIPNNGAAGAVAARVAARVAGAGLTIAVVGRHQATLSPPAN